MSNPVDVLTLIAEHWTELQGHAVSGVWVFGSAARGELRPDSDIDLLVEFDRPVSLFESARLRGHLQDLEELDCFAETDTLLELDLPTWMRERSRSRSAGSTIRENFTANSHKSAFRG